MQNEKKMVQMVLFKSINRHTDGENKAMDTKGEKQGGINWEIGIGIYTLLILCIKQITNENLPHRELYSMLCGNLNEKEIQKRGDICKQRVHSFSFTVEINTTL